MKAKSMRKIVAFAMAAVLAIGAAGATGVAQEVEAAGSVPTVKSVEITADPVLYDADAGKNILQVEAGDKFYIGDVIMGSVKYSNGVNPGAYVTGLAATYKSSDTNVCTVSAKGYVNPKETGSSVITVKYKKQKVKVTVEVKAAGSLSKSYSSSLKTKAAKIAKYSKIYKGTFNEKNAKKMIAAAKKCEKIIEPYYYDDYTKDRFAIETGFGVTKDGGNYIQNNKLIFPGCLHYHAMALNLSSEIYAKYNPFYRHTKNPVTITSVSAAAGTTNATITLSRKITDLEYTMLTYAGDGMENGKPTENCSIAISDKPGYLLYFYGIVKKGSNTFDGKVTYAFDKDYNYYISDDTTQPAEAQKLAKELTTFTKGKTYTLYTEAVIDPSGSLEYAAANKSWTGNYSFTVK